ncbi:hypothetical protein [Candidatus Cardinium hertigii]|uniref:Uncharacterized protein n=1 Tax=Candidatus Cardinium hertigii TaxID=247481 RepID=A0A3N2QDE9_9BACT|nr:hypothetical protein [Candidatus Cardinium hertigii]ROT47810.1 hypothetical protein EDM02_00335 [Candidatus Cardinium hertigii]
MIIILRQKMLPKIKKNLNTEKVKELEKKINEFNQASEKYIAMAKNLTEEEIESGSGAGIGAYMDQMRLTENKSLAVSLVINQIRLTASSKEVQDAILDVSKDMSDIVKEVNKMK